MASEGNSTALRWEHWGGKLGLPLVCLAGPILLAAAIYGVGDAIFAPTPTTQKPGFIDTLLGSHAVVAAIRLAIIFAAVFVAASVVALIARRQWLIRIGPVEVSERVSDFDAENQRLEESIENAEQTIDSLRYELAISNALLDRVGGSSGETE